MPWAVASEKSETPVAVQPDPAAQGWLEENPWFNTSPELTAAAYKCQDDVQKQYPGISMPACLGVIATRMRALYPDQVRDYGFVAVPDTCWLGAVPEVDVSVLVNERPIVARLPKNDGRPPEAAADLIWLLPLAGSPQPSQRMLGHFVTCLDRGGSICLSGSSKSALDQASAAILRMAGAAGSA